MKEENDELYISGSKINIDRYYAKAFPIDKIFSNITSINFFQSNLDSCKVLILNMDPIFYASYNKLTDKVNSNKSTDFLIEFIYF